MATKIEGYTLGKLIMEGKTKQVYDLPEHPGLCLLLSKDRITAGDGARAHDLVGKAEISNKTNGLVFDILNRVGLKTAYVKPCSPTSFIAKKCAMIPIEWVTRRLATGSFLKRYTGVPEGYRFAPPKQETFKKDDLNHDPQIFDEQIISEKMTFNGVLIGQDEIDIMRKMSVTVFEVLEKVWATRDCAFIDMKVEFGVDEDGNIVLADIIDSDSWRLWPSGHKALRVDKDVYRLLKTITEKDLDTVKMNFSWAAQQLEGIIPKNDHLVVILMGSASDTAHCDKIAKACKDLGLNTEVRVSSAHKGPEDTLKIMREYESVMSKLVFIAVAGRSNGLGPVLSGSTTYPVINCPPLKPENMQLDLWSSLNVPSGLGCATVLYPEAAALNAAQILSLSNFIIWGKLRTRQIDNLSTLKNADKIVRGLRAANSE